MSALRTSKHFRQIGERAYRCVAAPTGWLRMEPGFIVIGAQRCGTTSLFRALTAHPQLVRPLFHKGVNYFDLNYYRGTDWYRSHFPLAEIARRRTARYGPAMAFEASGYYLYHPFALQRIAGDLPAIKLVAMLRNPVERAFSAYKHEYARGFEQESFERALALEDERLAGEVDRMRGDPAYESFSHRHHSYRHRGQYAEQLERALALIPAERVHVIQSEAFFRQPAEEYRRLVAFLELRPFEPADFGQHNSRQGAPMDPKTRRKLEEHYAPHDQRLARMLGSPLHWSY
jgi:hypothetical protein